MIEAQVSRRPRLPQLTAKASVLGLAEIGADFDGRNVGDNLVRRTVALVGKLTKQGMVEPLPGSGQLNTGLYHDTGVWAHGLFGFAGDTDLATTQRVYSYLAWRPWNDSIILLAGSPLNVLGERVVRDGAWAYGTTGTWASIMRLVAHLRTDEPTSDRLPGAPWIEPPGAALDHRVVTPELAQASRGLSLATLCVRHLSGLPVEQLETVFRLHQRIDVDMRAPLPQWIRDTLGRGPGSAERLDILRRCESVYLGSALYTANV